MSTTSFQTFNNSNHLTQSLLGSNFNELFEIIFN